MSSAEDSRFCATGTPCPPVRRRSARGPDAGGLADWVGRLESGQSRGSILVGFSESVEYRAASEHEVVVTMAYVGMLRRAPEPGGFEFWVDKMDTGMTRISLMGGFFRSIEYANRFA